MTEQLSRSYSWLKYVCAGLGIAALVTVGIVLFFRSRTEFEARAERQLVQQTREFCSACHAYPPPDTFPRDAWAHEVEQGYEFFQKSKLSINPPPKTFVIDYYKKRALAELPRPKLKSAATPPLVKFERIGIAAAAKPYATSNINLVHLFDSKHLDILACDMRLGEIKVYSPYDKKPQWQILGKVSSPAHVEVADLNGDGIKDVLVACLGQFLPTDNRCGSVVWLRGSKSGRFEPITLLDGVGRVADVRSADFNGDAKPDLIVAEFGWREIGAISLLENCTVDWSKPKFKRRVLDERQGAIHVPITDLNNDGKPDFIALISQHYETIVAFINQGGHFQRKTIYEAPHPAYGSSGIHLDDLDNDGDLDILYSNGDSMDFEALKPWHSIQWLENRGTFPFVHHPITPFNGVHQAVTADADGDGDKDIFAVSFLPAALSEEPLESILFLEQVSPGRFARHVVEAGTCFHPTCACGDVMGTGELQFIVGNFVFDRKMLDPISIIGIRKK